MKLAASTLHLLHLPLEDAYQRITELPTKNIEVADSGNHTLNPDRVERLNELRSSHGLQYSVHSPYSDTNLCADDSHIREAIIERVERSIRYASTLEARCIVVHPGWTTATEKFNKGRGWQLNLASMNRLIKTSEEHGVNLLVENVPPPNPYLFVTVADLERFYRDIDTAPGMVLDVGHSNLQGETIKFLDRFGDRIKHIHVSDNTGDVDRHLPIGCGSIEWPRVIEAVRGTGFDGWLVVESYSEMNHCLDYLGKLI